MTPAPDRQEGGLGPPQSGVYDLVAVDGGGTKTEAVALDMHGRVGARLTVGPSNLQNLGEDGCRRALAAAIDGVLAEVGLKRHQIRAACLGVAGLDTDADAASYARIVNALFGPAAERVLVESDGFIPIFSGTRGRPGVALIAGTGSIATGVDDRGGRARAGGWGALLGDEGSAFDIGRQALMLALRAMDGRGRPTRLRADIERHFGRPLPEVVAMLYRQDTLRETTIASVAQLVAQAAEDGDRTSRLLLRKAAQELALCGRAVLAKLRFDSEPVPVVLSGSLFHSRILREEVERRLGACRVRLEFIRPALPPVAGACYLACRKAGIPVTGDFWDNLARGLSSGAPRAG
ncbi:MAG TPA: BadF/BadG/BcrA/BcrD ATPase family protein [Limnochordales bacterium]